MRQFANRFTQPMSSRERPCSRTATRTPAVLALLTLFMLAPLSPTRAKQSVLTVKSGWDEPGSKLGSGYVVYEVTSSRRACQPKLQITYILQGAEPNRSFDVGFDLFDLKGGGRPSFGVKRLERGSFKREDTTAVIDVYIVGKFMTDAAGNGEAHFELDLTGVPAGSYNAQFVWAQLPRARVFYRTGEKYAQGFAQINVP